MGKLYRGKVYGTLFEIDENKIAKNIYVLVSFDEEPYNVWDCLHSQAGLEIMTQLEKSVTLLTNEIEEEIVTELEKPIENQKDKKYEINIGPKSDSNYMVELEAKALSEQLKKYDKELDRMIKNWLENVYRRAKKYDKDLVSTTHWFERVYTFIKTGQKTRIKEIQEIFKMSENLFYKFDAYYEEDSRVN